MKKFFSWPLALIMAVSFLLACGASYLFIIRLPVRDILVDCILISLALAVIAHWRRFFALMLPFLALFLAVLYPFGFYTWAAEVFYEFTVWMWNYLPHPAFERLAVFLISLAVTLPVFILIRCHSPALILMLAGGTLFYGLENAGYDYPGILFWAFLLCILLQMTLFAEPKKGKKPLSKARGQTVQLSQGKQPATGWMPFAGLRMLTVLPLCLLAVWAASGFSGFDPLRAIREWGREWAGGWGGAVSVFGPGGPGYATDITDIGVDLGGPFSPRGDLMLTLAAGDRQYLTRWASAHDFDVMTNTNYPAAEGPYLRGGIGVHYDGRRWQGDGFEGVRLSPAEYHAEKMAPFIYYVVYDIAYEGLRGTRLYLPYDTVWVGMANEPVRLWYTGDVLHLPNSPAGEYHYTATSAVFDTRPARPPGSVLPDEPWDAYRGLPPELPARVGNLARSLAVYEEPYYNALAIERYLVELFTYNPNMPRTPEEEDFVDYFLFEQGEGHCTYFASAMTVLCRAAGIPARYVEGFAPSRTTDRSGQFLYTDDLAHAWCEAYLGEEEGWARFEPTPGYNRVQGPVWFPEPIRDTPRPPRPTPSDPFPSEEEPPPSYTPNIPSPAGEEDRSFPWGPLLTVLLPPLALLLCWSLLRLRRRRFERMLHAMPYTVKQAKRVYKHIQWMTGHAGVKRAPHETLGEFADRADAAWPTKQYISRRMSDTYGKTCYGTSPLTGEESEILRLHAELLEQREQIHLSPKRYYLYKHILSLL